MANPKKSDLEKPAPLIDDEDQATLAHIDEGIADSKAGRTVSLERIRELLPKWISGSSSINPQKVR